MSRHTRERRAAKRYARAHGYFWLPCPLCGEEFGGHEWMHSSTPELSAIIQTDTPGVGRGICPACTLARKGDLLFTSVPTIVLPR